MNKIFLVCIVLWAQSTISQSYTSYFTGNQNDSVVSASGGICLMGGATESDEAMKWFLRKANGGDILVIRASGADGYNNYLYSQLGVSVNSVETIVFNEPGASFEPYVHTRIQSAEAIWVAGGDQWDYVSMWRGTPVDSLINNSILTRNIAVGGTSAGMAIMGKYYFTAENGTVTSATALNNPYSSRVTIDSLPFLQNFYLKDVITDSHFDNPDRKGRAVTFMARALTDHNFPLKAITCDEYTAVCIEPDGMARVYGDYPSYDDNAYFLQPNCELQVMSPETCSAQTPLTWDLSGTAVRVCKIKGTSSGSNTFDLNDWKSDNGGIWEKWHVINGTFFEQAGNPINCDASALPEEAGNLDDPVVYPNPFRNGFTIDIKDEKILEVTLSSLTGKIINNFYPLTEGPLYIDPDPPGGGLYILTIITDERTYILKLVKTDE